MPTDYQKIESLFIEMMELTLKDTIAKLKSKEADSKDIRNAITLLKDNGFTLRDIPVSKKPEEFLAELAKTLPQLPAISCYGEIIEYDESEVVNDKD